MRFSFLPAGVMALTAVVVTPASAGDADSIAALSATFVHALQAGQTDAAAARFVPSTAAERHRLAQTLQHIQDVFGPFASMQPIARLPDGGTMKLSVPAPATGAFSQQVYAALARDGQRVFYEVNMSAGAPPRVVSFAVHVPAPDAAAQARVRQQFDAISRK